MTIQPLKHTTTEVLRVLFLGPILLAALIGALPLFIPCIACRCCTGLYSKLTEAIKA